MNGDWSNASTMRGPIVDSWRLKLDSDIRDNKRQLSRRKIEVKRFIPADSKMREEWTVRRRVWKGKRTYVVAVRVIVVVHDLNICMWRLLHTLLSYEIV